jgi:hypothetical protein
LRRGKKWTGPINASRQERGAFHTIVPKLVIEDDQDSDLPAGRVGTFRNYFRLRKEDFDKVLEKVTPIISKQDTSYRPSISAAEILMVTLRYIATGCSMTQLHYEWCISVASLSAIVPETCQAIYDQLKNDVLITPTTRREWESIAQEMENVWNFPNAIGK